MGDLFGRMCRIIQEAEAGPANCCSLALPINIQLFEFTFKLLL